MKKTMAMLLSAIMILSLSACGSRSQSGGSSSGADSPTISTEDGNVLVAYFSVPETDGVDTVSGATYSSKGILEAFRDILKQAKKGEAKPTVTPEITPTPTAAPIPTITPAPTVTPTPEASLTPEPSPTPEASPTPEPTAVPEPEGRYIDGTYTASSYGFEGMVNVTVTISGGQIVSIEQSNGDSPEYFDYAWNTILPQVTANQSPEGIDAASGATYSSEGILNAIRKALAQAAST